MHITADYGKCSKCTSSRKVWLKRLHFQIAGKFEIWFKNCQAVIPEFFVVKCQNLEEKSISNTALVISQYCQRLQKIFKGPSCQIGVDNCVLDSFYSLE